MQVTIKVPFTKPAIIERRRDWSDDVKNAIANSPALRPNGANLVENIAAWCDVVTATIIKSPNFQQILEMYVLNDVRGMVTELSAGNVIGGGWSEIGAWTAIIDTAPAWFPEIEIEFLYDA